MKTAMQELIENAKTAKEHSKDGYVTYDEVIEVATELLEKEKSQIMIAFVSGQRDSFGEAELSRLMFSEDYWNEIYTNQTINNG